jgi:hypothetical protein
MKTTEKMMKAGFFGFLIGAPAGGLAITVVGLLAIIAQSLSQTDYSLTLVDVPGMILTAAYLFASFCVIGILPAFIAGIVQGLWFLKVDPKTIPPLINLMVGCVIAYISTLLWISISGLLFQFSLSLQAVLGYSLIGVPCGLIGTGLRLHQLKAKQGSNQTY